MAWTTMHYAVGMGCAGVAAGAACCFLRRGWRWLPACMTLGGVWALIPDMPRIWREDVTSLPFGNTLGSKQLEKTLHDWGDWFFFHQRLDAQPHEYALHGLVIILVLYNASLAMLMWMEHKQRNSLANRAWRAHRGQRKLRRQKRPRPDVIHSFVDDGFKKTG